ncbi:hypothetical protein Rin_00015290 [Candidatus Regiella insecticola 5.15]|uniref:Uncharacterized protein n=2 Tax=Candidatus Regiella insecticola TaxID=138073 RepID=G2H0F1_9ENTR|nr:hypothetical protein Rin_00015290 [Candidatus Regiella insecticola 5.15]
MPIEIRELMIKATLRDPPDFRGETTRLAAGANAGDPSQPEPQDQDARWRQLIAAQLERLLPEHVERLLSRDGFFEQALTDQIGHILARMKER